MIRPLGRIFCFFGLRILTRLAEYYGEYVYRHHGGGMIKRVATVFLIILMLLAGFQIPARALSAGINTGIEWRFQDDQLTASGVRLNWLASERWTVRGIYQWEERDLSAGFTYKQSRNPRISSYVGLGFRDLLNEAAPGYELAEKMEIITGFEIGLSKYRNGASILFEIRAVGSEIANRAEGKALEPIVSMALNFRLPGRRVPPVKIPDSISEADFDLLVRLVAAEAGGEPYEGQVAVAAVVFNRMRSYKFPNTVREVIYQKNQFSSVPKLPYIQPGESCRRAVVDALNGVDPSNGALYFYNPETSSKEGLRFFNSADLRVTAKIGNHVFLTE